jgi:gas vesicle protein
MSDTRYSGGAGTSDSGKSSVQQAKDLAGDLGKQASEVAQHATSRVKEQVSGMTESAKELASDAGDRLRTAVQDQKNAGADFISGMAGAVRRAANEFDDQMPLAGQYIRRAAAQIDGASEALRRHDLNDLVGGVQDFARRQPTAFLGATVLAGFAVVRLLKSSSAPQPSSWQQGSPQRSSQQSSPQQSSMARQPGSAETMWPEHRVSSPGMQGHRPYGSGLSQDRR